MEGRAEEPGAMAGSVDEPDGVDECCRLMDDPTEAAGGRSWSACHVTYLFVQHIPSCPRALTIYSALWF